MSLIRRRMMNSIKTESITPTGYMAIVAEGEDVSITVPFDAYYFVDSGSWLSVASGDVITISDGSKAYFKAEGLTPTSSAGIGTFAISGACSLEGNCMSLLLGDNFNEALDLTGYDSAFYKLFYNCTTIVSVSETFLPATTLASNCYYYMFRGCTGLTSAPELPATTLASNCYSYMFYGCTGLTSAPELPATTLASNCYYYMFYGCTGLTSAPELPATTLAMYCYYYMFRGCTGLTSAPELPATTLASNCYTYMFRGCTGLTSAPELPATTLAMYCYSYMFYGCTGLTSAPELPATTLASNCYTYMFRGCTGLTSAPELPATTLASNCYSYMFYGCSNLNYIKALFTTTPSSGYTNNWVSGVASSGTFVKSDDATWDVTGVNGVPSGWTVIGGKQLTDNYITVFVNPNSTGYYLDIEADYSTTSVIYLTYTEDDGSSNVITLYSNRTSWFFSVGYLSSIDSISPTSDANYRYILEIF